MTFDDFDCYVVHYTPLVDRKQFLLRQFKKEGIAATFVENFDREQLSYQQVYDNFKMNLWEYQRRSPTGYSPYLYPMKPADVSNCMKHKEAFRKFLTESSKEYMFLMEDDVILCENFVSTLDGYLRYLPSDWSAAFIGQGAGKRIPSAELRDGVIWYHKDHPADRCADSVLLKRSTVQAIYNGMVSHGIAFPPDHELSFWFRSYGMKIYWLEPPIVAQGSQTGYFESYQDALSGKYEDKTIRLRSDMRELL
jgi:hypothetical protein